MHRIILIFFLCLFPYLVWAQAESKLAAQYFRNGEYEKAASLYQQLYEKTKGGTYYFNKYVECLVFLQEYQEAEDIVRKQIKKTPKDLALYVTYGNMLEKQNKFQEADEKFESAIKKLSGERSSVIKLANAFVGLTKYDYAIKTYERGAKMVKDPNVFAYYLGDLYQRQGDSPKMISNYLLSLKDAPNRLVSIQKIFQRVFSDDDYPELQSQLYGLIQDNDDNVLWIEVLAWSFIQQKDFSNALRQMKALDRRLDEGGNRVYEIGAMASNAKEYDTAIEAYEYIISQKGPYSSFYIDAKRDALRCKRKQLVMGYQYTTSELEQLEMQYLIFLEEFGKNKRTASIVIELAELQAFYLNDLPKAGSLLGELVDYPGLDPKIKAKSKLMLADIYLMQGERWESTLLYSQVDKDFKEDQIGHEARFRNAKLSYYMGDFEWAQAQFEVLKASTSKLIANDALDLSVFIMDNMGLDTTTESLMLYAQADLEVFQNKFDDAFKTLSSLLEKFPDHALQDDVLYTKAHIHVKLREYDQAVDLYQQILENHREEIRADNALFELAELYENQLGDVDKAKALYEQLFLDFSGSTFSVEARKRYRLLRGDEL